MKIKVFLARYIFNWDYGVNICLLFSICKVYNFNIFKYLAVHIILIMFYKTWKIGVIDEIDYFLNMLCVKQYRNINLQCKIISWYLGSVDIGNTK